MAIHFRPEGYNRWADLGASLGSAVGMGTSAYLGHKKQERAKEDREKALVPIVGAEKAKLFANLDDQTLNFILKNEQSEKERGALSNLSSQLGKYGQGQSPQDMQNVSPQGNVMGNMSDTLDRPSAQMEQPTSMTEKLLSLNREGVNPQHFKELFNEASTLDKIRQAERKNQSIEDAPQRKLVVGRVNDLERKTEKAPRRIADYELVDKIARSGKLSAGLPRKVLETFGFPDNWQGSESDVAVKLMSNLNFERMLASVPGGKATAKLMEEIAKTNPSIYNEPKSISVLSQLMINQEKEDMMLNEEVQNLVDKNKGKIPLDVMKQANRNIKPELTKLHERSKDLIEKSYDLKPDKKKQEAKSLKDFSAYDIVQDEDTGEYLVIEANGKPRKATAQELKAVGVQ